MNIHLAKHIKVVKGQYHYIVAIFGAVYEMSTDCNMPNGVNYYLGDVSDNTDLLSGDEIPLDEVHDNIKRSIVCNIDFYYNLEK